MISLEDPLYLERFYLRHLHEADANEKYLSWFSDEKVKQFIDYAKKNNKLNDLKKFIREKNESNKCVFFGVFVTSNDDHIGNIKYEPINFEKKTAEMGILIGDINWRGKGVGPEVIIGSAKWLKEKFSIKKMTLGVLKENKAAVNAYQKIGFCSDYSELGKTSNSLRMTLNLDDI
tara:strand:+ start:1446 stop:1970 length:525 start_codon:yes stop_codon:yes gene_type:complete